MSVITASPLPGSVSITETITGIVVTQTLAHFVKTLGRASQGAFDAQIVCPVLVESAYADIGSSGAKSFRTEFVDAAEALSQALPSDKREVFLVKKRTDSTFSGHVGVGRTPNLDISIARTGISKFHAYFSQTDDIWRLTDKDSTNGTYVGGVRLTPGTPVVLVDGVEVQFANHAFQFLSPKRFKELLHSLV